ncbi:MAG: M28 family peptidase [Candidatus Hodarchaeota archaeon]
MTNSIIIKTELLPSTEEMMHWITEICDQGIRRPGYQADEWVETWIKEKYVRFGLKEINLDPISIKKWESKNPKLKLWFTDNPESILDVPCFPLPYSTPTDGVEAELAFLKKDIKLSNKIGVLKLKLIKLPTAALKSIADRYYDPKNEFDNLKQLMPFGIIMQDAINYAIGAKASAFIGILSNYPWETQDYYVPYDAIIREIPGAWVSPNNGKKVLRLMRKGKVTGRISYQATVSEATSNNITATLKGQSDDWIIISTHHDGPWASAVEDASGIALVLAQAKYWSKIPQDQRPFNMMFVLTAAHMSGGMGVQKFVERNKEFLSNVVATITLEHVAKDSKGKKGKLALFDEPVVRWWFTSRITPLEEITEEAIKKEDLYRSIIMPPDGFPPGRESPPSDASPFHLAETPIISLLTAPPYLFDPADTPDKVHKDSLVPITRAVIRIINALKGHTAEGFRKEVRKKFKRSKLLQQFTEKLREDQF